MFYLCVLCENFVASVVKVDLFNSLNSHTGKDFSPQ